MNAVHGGTRIQRETDMTIKKAEKDEAVVVQALKQGVMRLNIIGQTPLYLNSMSAKAKRDLLVGSKKKTAAEKRDVKHDPEAEFRDSVYLMPQGPTLIGFPAPGVKEAMATAALETPGIAKTSVRRLIFLPEERISIWGTPLLKMDVVRSADLARTPDVRTRAFLPRWGATIEIRFVTPTLNVGAIVNLLANAGVIVGIGDFRQEKGRGSYGTFRVLSDSAEDAEEWEALQAEGRAVQTEALANPTPADAETSELLDFLRSERVRRAA